MKVVYLAGPGDIIRTFNYWREGINDPNELNITYSSQFFDVCDEMKIDAYIISSNKRKDTLKSGRFNIEHRPNRLSKESGLKYHAGIFLYTIGLIITIVRYRADVLIVSGGVYWFLLSILSLFGVKIIPSLHCTLYSNYKKRSTVNSIIDKIDSLFFSSFCYSIMSASFELTRQIKKIVNNTVPIVEFLPLYSSSTFASIKEASFDGKQLEIIYIGRVEYEKGIFDLLEIYRLLKKSGINLKMNICGAGSMLAEVKENILVMDAAADIVCHGHCDRDQLTALISKSHLFVVPTRTDFLEGFNQVVVEAVLSGRPVITSDVCPAMEHVKSAVLEVKADDINDYVQKIQDVFEERSLFKSKLNACEKEREQFFSEDNSWKYGLKKLLLSIQSSSSKAKSLYLKGR